MDNSGNKIHLLKASINTNLSYLFLIFVLVLLLISLNTYLNLKSKVFNHNLFNN